MVEVLLLAFSELKKTLYASNVLDALRGNIFYRNNGEMSPKNNNGEMFPKNNNWEIFPKKKKRSMGKFFHKKKYVHISQ